MTTLPPITVSHTDRERLYALLERLGDDTDQTEYLYQELDRAEVVPHDRLPAHVVGLGSRMRFRNTATNKAHERVLVMPNDSHHSDDTISILSPVGAALLGLEQGAQIEWPHRNGVLPLLLLEVSRD